MITKELLQYGFDEGFVTLDKSDGVVCRIGEHWFYFGGQEAEDYDDPVQYLREHGERDVLDMIYNVLEDFRTGDCFEQEYAYYDAYLHEKLLALKDAEHLHKAVAVIDDEDSGKMRIVITLGHLEQYLDPLAAMKAASKDFLKTDAGRRRLYPAGFFNYGDFLNDVPEAICLAHGFFVLDTEIVTNVGDNADNLLN